MKSGSHHSSQATSVSFERSWHYFGAAAVLLNLLSFFLVRPEFFRLSIILGVLAGVAFTWHLWGDPVVVTRRLDRRETFVGDPIQVSYQVKNQSWLPWFNLALNTPRPEELAGDCPVSKAVSLMPKEAHEFTCVLRPMKRGIWVLPGYELVAADPFRLEAKKYAWEEPVELLVYPRIVPLESLDISPSELFGNHRTQNRQLTNPASLAGLHKYVPGEPLRQIHWKATAHTGHLQTKEFELRGANTVELVVDLFKGAQWEEGNVSTMDSAASLAASLAFQLANSGDVLGLHMYGDQDYRIPPSGANIAVWPILRNLAICTSGDVPPIRQLLPSLGFRHRSSLLLITPDGDPGLLESISLLKKNGHRITVFLIARERPGVVEMLQWANIGAFWVQPLREGKWQLER